jgi:hypothetical protein
MLGILYGRVKSSKRSLAGMKRSSKQGNFRHISATAEGNCDIIGPYEVIFSLLIN